MAAGRSAVREDEVPAEVECTSLLFFTEGVSRRTYKVGDKFPAARDLAASLQLRGFVTTSATFTAAELKAPALEALAELEAEGNARRMDPEKYLALPRPRATLERLAKALGLDGPSGPGRKAS